MKVTVRQVDQGQNLPLGIISLEAQQSHPRRKRSKRHEGFTPLLETFAAVALLLLVGAASFLQPIGEELVVLLQQQILSQYHVSLVETLLLEPFSQDVADAGKVRHRFFPHGLGNEVPMFLRCRRHGFASFVQLQRTSLNKGILK